MQFLDKLTKVGGMDWWKSTIFHIKLASGWKLSFDQLFKKKSQPLFVYQFYTIWFLMNRFKIESVFNEQFLVESVFDDRFYLSRFLMNQLLANRFTMIIF